MSRSIVNPSFSAAHVGGSALREEASAPWSQAGERFAYIDRTKGLAILLVVVGHLVAREMPPGDEAQWYRVLKDRIYAFHMPLFMAISGMVYGLSWRPAPGLLLDLSDASRRALRLLPAFLLFGLLVFAGKWFFQVVTGNVDNPVQGAQDLLNLLLRPSISFTSSLWYIYALMLLYVAFPLAFRAAGGRLWVLMIAAVGCWLLPASTWLAWDHLHTLTVFFTIGVAAGQHHGVAMGVLRHFWFPAAMAWGIALPFADQHHQAVRWLVAGLSIVALPGLLLHTAHWPLQPLQVLGRYTFIIYLTNTIIIGLIKVASVKLGFWHAKYLIPISVLMTLAATIGPVQLKRWLLPRAPLLRRFTG